jgi:hypothetical protein
MPCNVDVADERIEGTHRDSAVTFWKSDKHPSEVFTAAPAPC